MTPNLTSLITANSGDTYASGQILTGVDPTYGYLRNASGRTDFNFNPTDARSLGLDYQGVGIIIEGIPDTGPAATPTATATASASYCHSNRDSLANADIHCDGHGYGLTYRNRDLDPDTYGYADLSSVADRRVRKRAGCLCSGLGAG
jgi:hypothetical protein